MMCFSLNSDEASVLHAGRIVLPTCSGIALAGMNFREFFTNAGAGTAPLGGETEIGPGRPGE
jgi:hypothetical protein